MAYQVKLANFEGPLDLLLFLIQENEIDIYDIPIALITQQYLEYLELMKLLDLEVGSEFLLMAATLLRIKAKMLLPRRLLDEEGEEEDPRQELVRRLVEYRQFKELASVLGGHEDAQREVFSRPSTVGWSAGDGLSDEVADLLKLDVNLWDLIQAFKEVLDRTGGELPRTVDRESITIEEKMEEILHRLADCQGLFFRELFPDGWSRAVVVITFLALLELIRLRRVIVEQTETLGEVWLCRATPQPEPSVTDGRGES